MKAITFILVILKRNQAMNNKEAIEFSSKASEKTNHELFGMIYQKHEEIRLLLSILNRREEENEEVIKLAKKGKAKETPKE